MAFAKLNLRAVESRFHYAGKDKRLTRPDMQIVSACDASNLENGQLAR